MEPEWADSPAPGSWRRRWASLAVSTLILTCSAPASAQFRIDPDADDDEYAVDWNTEGHELPVLANDSGLLIRIVSVGDISAGGIVQVTGNGQAVVYSPAPGFSGIETFEYAIADIFQQTAVAEVTVTVIRLNQPPAANDDAFTIAEDSGSHDLDVVANDADPDPGDAIRVVSAGGAQGDLEIVGNRVRYRPPPGFVGMDSFVYEIRDEAGESDSASVAIEVTNVNDPPVITGQRNLVTAEDTTIPIVFSDLVVEDPDDSYPSGFTLAVQGGANYTVSGANVTPARDFVGVLNVPVVVHDGVTGSAPFPLRIDVTPVDDAPVFTSAPVRDAAEDAPYRYRLRATDADGDALTFGAVELPAWLKLEGDTLSGVPSVDAIGRHSVGVTVSDGTGAPVEQRFEVAVSAVNDMPVIEPDPIPEQTVTENLFAQIDLRQFVTDEDNAQSELGYRLSPNSEPLPQGLSLSADGVISGTPRLGASVGDHAVRFVVSDGDKERTSEPFLLKVLEVGRVDLSVTISAEPNPVAIGEPVTWTIAVANNTPDIAVSGIAASASQAGEAAFAFDTAGPGCLITGAGDEARVACEQTEPLPGGTQTTFLLQGTAAAAGDVSLSAEVSITAHFVDASPGNDRATETLAVAGVVNAAPAQKLASIDARSVAVGDLDGDGFDDLAVATGAGEATLVFLNGIDPGNPRKRRLADVAIRAGGTQGAVDLALDDVDADGDLDIVTVGETVEVLINDGTATFSAVAASAGGGVRAAAVADVDGDGLADLVLARAGASVLLRGIGGSQFGPEQRLGAGDARDVEAVDLFGSAAAELVFANADGNAEIFGIEAGALSRIAALPIGPTTSVASADIDGDGFADLVFGADTPQTGDVAPTSFLFLNDAAASRSFGAPIELAAGPVVDVLLADPDLDADPDFLFVNRNGGLRTFVNDRATGSYAAYPVQIDGDGAIAVGAGKLGTDARMDIALAGPNGIAILYGDGRGGFGVGDTAAPSLQLIGAATVEILVGDAFVDPGATATDAIDGDLSAAIEIDGSVDENVIGTYSLTYAVADSSGNMASPLTRTVVVEPLQAVGGGGGGALDLWSLLCLALAAFCGAKGCTATGSGRAARGTAANPRSRPVCLRAGRWPVWPEAWAPF